MAACSPPRAVSAGSPARATAPAVPGASADKQRAASTAGEVDSTLASGLHGHGAAPPAAGRAVGERARHPPGSWAQAGDHAHHTQLHAGASLSAAGAALAGSMPANDGAQSARRPHLVLLLPDPTCGTPSSSADGETGPSDCANHDAASGARAEPAARAPSRARSTARGASGRIAVCTSLADTPAAPESLVARNAGTIACTAHAHGAGTSSALWQGGSGFSQQKQPQLAARRVPVAAWGLVPSPPAATHPPCAHSAAVAQSAACRNGEAAKGAQSGASGVSRGARVGSAATLRASGPVATCGACAITASAAVASAALLRPGCAPFGGGAQATPPAVHVAPITGGAPPAVKAKGAPAETRRPQSAAFAPCISPVGVLGMGAALAWHTSPLALDGASSAVRAGASVGAHSTTPPMHGRADSASSSRTYARSGSGSGPSPAFSSPHRIST